MYIMRGMVSESQRWIRLGMNFFVVCVSLCHVTSSLDFQYHDYQDLTNYLTNMSNTYPDLTHLYSIGKTVQKRDLHVLAIGKLPQNHLSLRPHVKYVGNMHGNEAVGREMLLHLIDYYLTNYNVNSTIKTFLDNTVVHILPSMNPDGFEVSSEGDCSSVQGRTNTNNYDLNRNFPGYFEVNPRPVQPETRAVMDWLKQHRFILSANLHGGAMVANYPFDNYVNGSIIQATRYVRSPDDDTFIHLSKVYSYSHANMYTGTHCNDDFPDGITNGALWYPVLGTHCYRYSHANMYTGTTLYLRLTPTHTPTCTQEHNCNDDFPDGITNGALWYPVLGRYLRLLLLTRQHVHRNTSVMMISRWHNQTTLGTLVGYLRFTPTHTPTCTQEHIVVSKVNSYSHANMYTGTHCKYLRLTPTHTPTCTQEHIVMMISLMHLGRYLRLTPTHTPTCTQEHI
ncbi:carboxypeptidase D, partial [Mytilus galloprovincialis]